ncbi:uncharacterized protein LOC116802555 isoform X3 [Drosophila sechellia]|uniref:uncharacterized protein LOC116802555 isoform X2 n=1 Tax=Drosophila sechellia TaxID=7238 RepID=UPI0013DDD589|nr:uncharacterized protein LOC116802555 isoform X2 [Drosophila sechellia]XP_032582888.1 uncharacterized protein LOC116802555 isoform X3 [Drosophila sechellia]
MLSISLQLIIDVSRPFFLAGLSAINFLPPAYRLSGRNTGILQVSIFGIPVFLTALVSVNGICRQGSHFKRKRSRKFVGAGNVDAAEMSVCCSHRSAWPVNFGARRNFCGGESVPQSASSVGLGLSVCIRPFQLGKKLPLGYCRQTFPAAAATVAAIYICASIVRCRCCYPGAGQVGSIFTL